MKKFIALFSFTLQMSLIPVALAHPGGKDGHRGGPMKELDKNGDQMLSVDEVKDHPRLNEKFAEIDTNSDGQLTKDEMKAHKKAKKHDGHKGEKPVPAE